MQDVTEDTLHKTPAATAEAMMPRALAEEEIRGTRTTAAQLAEWCRQRGLDDRGRKGDLVERLLRFYGTRWVFPSVVRCPTCRSKRSLVQKTIVNRQKRICQMPVCRREFTVYGQRV